MNAMTMPGFNAETSLYKTSVHYRLMAASVQANGVMLQQLPRPFQGKPDLWCTDFCYVDESGRCVKDCLNCYGGRPPDDTCDEFIVSCPASECRGQT
jgi:hypothetical protein